MHQIKLQSSDGESFPVDVEIAKKCETIKTMLEDLGITEDDDEQVPLPNVTSPVLEKVLEWAEQHRVDPPPPEDDPEKPGVRNREIPQWDKDWFKPMEQDQGLLFDLILAANYLDIKGLLDVGCLTVANMIRGKTPEEIRNLFNIKNDFNPEEEKGETEDK